MIIDYEGGPAFPTSPPLGEDGASASGYPYPHTGMSLRDYFAAKAMQALIGTRHHGYQGEHGAAHVAEDAFDIADEMLKASNK